MATVGTYSLGTRADTKYDTNSSVNTTWTAWAEEAITRTFDFWTEAQDVTGVCDDGPTLDIYPTLEPVQEQQPELTVEEAEKEKKEQERFEQLRIKDEKERKEAEHKAKVLLLELIGRVDYKQFCRAGYVDVEGNSGKVYRVKPRTTTKVFAGKDKLDVALESLCIEMKDRALPEADEIVWKKLMIESDEQAFVKTANHYDH